MVNIDHEVLEICACTSATFNEIKKLLAEASGAYLDSGKLSRTLACMSNLGLLSPEQLETGHVVWHLTHLGGVVKEGRKNDL